MEIYIPSCKQIQDIKITHLAISAHQDDVEIMAYAQIYECFGKNTFASVCLTDGGGSPRTGEFKDYSYEDMKRVRKQEQKNAADTGKYGAQIFLDHTSSEIKDKNNKEVISELKQIILMTKPDYILTHNIADKHETHVACALRVIEALREIKKEACFSVKKLYGCEVWRSLDWLDDREEFDCGGDERLERELLSVYRSQIQGGKRYDVAAIGRRRANATFSRSHSTDTVSALSYAMDMTELVENDCDIKAFIDIKIENFKNSILNNIERFM